MLDDAGEPVVMDFGSCTPLHRSIETREEAARAQELADAHSSAPYRAPELFHVMFPCTLDGQSDIWSLGCLLYCMAFGTSPFETPQEGFLKLACLNGKVRFPNSHDGKKPAQFKGQTYSMEFCQFIRDILTPDPKERPTMMDLLEISHDLQ